MIELIIGPMFAGKTKMLIRRGRERLKSAREDGCMSCEEGSPIVIALRPVADTRDEEQKLVSRGGDIFPAARFDCSMAIDLLVPHGTSLVLLDEANIAVYQDDQDVEGLISSLLRLEERGIDVCVAALTSDHRGASFAPAAQLVTIATHITVLAARCGVCEEPARFTARKSNHEQLVVIGNGIYEPRCAAHFIRGGHNGRQIKDSVD